MGQICHSSRGEVTMSDFPTIKSTHSLVAKYVTKPIWDKLSSVKTATSGFTLAQAIACAVEFDNQHRLARGIKAVGDSVKAESGKDFMLDAKYGYVHSCPTNLGTGMRASVHV